MLIERPDEQSFSTELHLFFSPNAQWREVLDRLNEDFKGDLCGHQRWHPRVAKHLLSISGCYLSSHYLNGPFIISALIRMTSGLAHNIPALFSPVSKFTSWHHLVVTVVAVLGEVGVALSPLTLTRSHDQRAWLGETTDTIKPFPRTIRPWPVKHYRSDIKWLVPEGFNSDSKF